MTRVQHACDTHACVKLPVSGTVSSQGITASEFRDSLLAPREKLTGQSLTFIERTVPEILTVFEGSTQCERTIDHTCMRLLCKHVYSPQARHHSHSCLAPTG